MTIQIVKLANNHLKAAAELLNQEYKDSVEFIPFSEERIQAEIIRRHLKILVAEENNKVLGLIATHSHENSEEHVTWLTALEGNEQQAIENTLVDEFEKRTDANTVIMMIEEKSPSISAWVKRGYSLEPGYQQMTSKLDSARTVLKVGKNVKLRTLRKDEEEEIVEVVNAGFGHKRLEIGDLEAWKSVDAPFNEDWVQIAEVDGRIVSVVVAKPDTDSVRYLHLRRGYLGPAATLPEFRNMHLASALTAQAMNCLFEKGMDSVRLGTSETNVSSNALLRNLGFQIGDVTKILRKKLNNAAETESTH
jgi:ribosomal protein S18 acetylase RimI-like enzyme